MFDFDEPPKENFFLCVGFVLVEPVEVEEAAFLLASFARSATDKIGVGTAAGAAPAAEDATVSTFGYNGVEDAVSIHHAANLIRHNKNVHM